MSNHSAGSPPFPDLLDPSSSQRVRFPCEGGLGLLCQAQEGGRRATFTFIVIPAGIQCSPRWEQLALPSGTCRMC